MLMKEVPVMLQRIDIKLSDTLEVDHPFIDASLDLCRRQLG